jgi:hypothetical protein
MRWGKDANNKAVRNWARANRPPPYLNGPSFTENTVPPAALAESCRGRATSQNVLEIIQ